MGAALLLRPTLVLAVGRCRLDLSCPSLYLDLHLEIT